MYLIDPSGVSWVQYYCFRLRCVGGVKGVNKLNYLYLIKVLLYTQLIYLQGYHGCATGKAKQAAKTEIEKLKVRSMGVGSCAVKHALYMYYEMSGVNDFATL